MLCKPPPGTPLDQIKAYTDIFFEEEHRDEAKRMCFRCPEQAECLRRGLREASGVWGGLGESERRNLAALLDEKGLTL